VEALLARGRLVVGIDNLNPYYDPALKRARVARLAAAPGFRFIEGDIADPAALPEASAARGGVIHLAAQAGVRHSFEQPRSFVSANLVGFFNVAELARQADAPHFLFASTSSVYGANPRRPFRETDPADHPLSFYAATKKANEAMAHALAHVGGPPSTGLRFFTVYGPWGRPDMSFFRFAERMLKGEPIQLHNHGRMTRDFTYIDDIVRGVLAAFDKPPAVDPDWAAAPTPATSGAARYRIFNIGSGAPVDLATYVQAFEKALGLKAIVEYVDMHPGEALDTHADSAALAAWTGVRPQTPLDVGVARFLAWYRDYYGL